MERYKCRTCLDIVDRKRCTKISKTCFLDQSIKELIILLVPTMVSTLSDDDLICRNCLKILKSTLKFIERCLQVEIIIAENKNQEDFENRDLSDCKENISEIDEETIILVKPSEQIDQDHDYYIKYESVNSDDTELQNANQNGQSDQTSESRPIEIIFDSSMVNTEDNINESRDNYQLPIQIIFDNSSVYNENTSENAPDEGIVKLETLDDANLDVPEYIKYEEECMSESSLKNEYFCQTCSQEFPSKYEYGLHLEIHPAFICEHCEKCFKTEYHYKRHMKIHEESVKICEICGKLFTNDHSLNCHINEEHNKIVYMCDQCPKIFKNKFRLTYHIRMVHENLEQHQCPQCEKLFHKKESFENHFRLVHLQLKPFVCDVCGREFGRKDYLQKHMYYHTGEPRPKQHRNKIPKRKTNRGKPPKFGIRLKDPGTPVNCKICGKLILSVHLLKSHLQSHVKIKRHKCSYCELTFTLSNNRDRHQRIHEADPEKKFRCNICWKKMKTEEELEHHIVGHYNRPPQHSCDICGEKFHRKYLLDNHHLHKHTDPGDIERAEKEIVIDNLLEYAHPNDMYDYK